MTRITIKEDIKNLKRNSFADSLELMEELAEAHGFKVSWAVPDEKVSDKDLQMIEKAKKLLGRS